MQVKPGFNCILASWDASDQFRHNLFHAYFATCFASYARKSPADATMNSVETSTLPAAKCVVHQRIEELTARIATILVVFYRILGARGCLQLAFASISHELWQA